MEMTSREMRKWISYFFLLFLYSLAQANNVGVILESQSSLLLPNNAIVSANQIGESFNEALQCFTNDTVTFNIGQWRSPDGTILGISPSEPVYNLRAPGIVRMYRTATLTTNLEGIYTCTIPDTNGREHSIYIGVYNQDNFTRGAPVIPNPPTFTLLTPFDQHPPVFTLSCISTSFPPTFVTWFLDNERLDTNSIDNDDFVTTQMLLDTVTTRYHTQLTVSSNYSGVFECVLNNTVDGARSMYEVTEPSAPPNLLPPVFLGSGDVNITWSRPSVVYGYQLFYRQSSPVTGPEEVVNITSPDTTHTVLRALTAGATYDITILAYADLPTVRSDTLSITLNVAGFAENITVITDSPTSLNVSWFHTGESVVEYIIRYDPTGNGCPDVPGGTIKAPRQATMFTLTALEEDSEYSITISTVSEAAEGEPSAPVIGRTSISAPSAPPTNISVVTTDPDTVFVSWAPPPCLDRNGPITGYILQYIEAFVSRTPRIVEPMNRFNTTLENRITAFRNISFQVRAVNDGGDGRLSTPIYDHLIASPGSIISPAVISTDIVSVELQWSQSPLIEPVFYNTLNYTVSYAHSQTPDQTIKAVSGIRSLRYTVSNLLPNTTYIFYITPVSSFSPGLPRDVSGNTELLVAVSDFVVVQAGNDFVNITWTRIESRDIMFYEIYYNSSDSDIANVSVNLTQSFPIVLSNLNNKRTYDFSVVAVVIGNGSEVRGPPSEIRGFTFTVTDNSMRNIIIISSVIGGLVVLIVVIIITVIFLVILSKNLGPELANKDTYETSYIPLDILQAEKGEDEIDSATPARATPTISGNLSGDVHSVEGQEVVIRFMVHGNPKPSIKWTLDGEEIDWDTSSIVHREATIVFKRVEVEHAGVYKLSAVNANGTCNKTVKLIVYPDTEITRHPAENEAVSSVSITLDNFGQYVASLHSNGNKLFREQFKMLSSGEAGHPVKEVLADQYRPYNRFQHILVYDNNRIQLQSLPRYLDCLHTYINACYVKSKGEKPRRFIATQGPLEQSIADIWRLVWQEKASVIVMLTKIREDLRIKCAQYWPSKGSSRHGPFTVSLLQETMHNGYTIREFSVHYNSLSNNVRSRIVNPVGKTSIEYKEAYSDSQSTLRVTQYQYHDWPEHSTTENISTLLEMHEQAVTRSNLNPMVVHCSNGVGRTGAFIAMDMALEQATKQQNIDIPAIVTNIRNQRMKMIQTLDQFMLVHDAIIEKIVCGETHMHVKNLHSKLMNLDKKGNNGLTGYEEQFNILEQVTVSPENALCSYAKEFPKSNREGHALPTNQWRVALKGESPDYINATCVLGYNNPKGYIITQGPFRETRRDFWKMVHDQEITTIVMLSSVTESDTEVCSQYWPSTGSIEFGEFLVFVKDTFENSGFIRRIMIVKELKTSSVRRIVQYEVTGWDDSMCDNVIGVVNTINLVTTTQRKTPHIPILLHCSNGIGRSAIFSIAMTTIERCKIEGMVDVFQLVKKMRAQLPGVIQNKEQYRLIHQLVAAYLNIFSTSANFDEFEFNN